MYTFIFLNAARGNVFMKKEKPCSFEIEGTENEILYIGGSVVIVNGDGDAVVIGEAKTHEDMIDTVVNAIVMYDMKYEVAASEDYITNFKEYFERLRICRESDSKHYYEYFVRT